MAKSKEKAKKEKAKSKEEIVIVRAENPTFDDKQIIDYPEVRHCPDGSWQVASVLSAAVARPAKSVEKAKENLNPKKKKEKIVIVRGEVPPSKPAIIDYPEDRKRLKEEFAKIADSEDFAKSVELAKDLISSGYVPPGQGLAGQDTIWGVKVNPKACVKELFFPHEGGSYQCPNARGHGPHGLYCEKHKDEPNVTSNTIDGRKLLVNGKFPKWFFPGGLYWDKGKPSQQSYIHNPPQKPEEFRYTYDVLQKVEVDNTGGTIGRMPIKIDSAKIAECTHVELSQHKTSGYLADYTISFCKEVPIRREQYEKDMKKYERELKAYEKKKAEWAALKLVFDERKIKAIRKEKMGLYKKLQKELDIEDSWNKALSDNKA